MGDGGDAGQVPEFFPGSWCLVLLAPELQDLGQIRGEGTLEFLQFACERTWIYEYLCRCWPRRNVQQFHGSFEEGAPGLNVGPAVEFPYSVRPVTVIDLIPKPSEPDDAYVLQSLRCGQEKRRRIRRRSRGDDGQRSQARFFYEELEAGARHEVLAALHGAFCAGDAGHVAAAEGDHPLGLLLVHAARARAVGRRVVHGDDASHLQRFSWHTKSVGDGELVVDLVNRVAVEDYACGSHRLLALDSPVTPP